MSETLKEAREKIFGPRNKRGATPITAGHIGKHIITLDRNESGYYMPCLSKLVKLTACKAQIDMYNQGDDIRSVSHDAVYHTPDCEVYDLSDLELIAHLKKRFPQSEDVICKIDRTRLINAVFSNALPLRVNEDGTCHWPCDTGVPMHDTCSKGVEVKTVSEINSAIRAKRVVWYNSPHWDGTKRRADKARTHRGNLQVHNVNGYWTDVTRSVCVYYDPEAI